MLRDEYLNTEAIDAECSALADEMVVVEALTKKLIAENATTAMPQDEYNRKYDALVQRYHAAEERIAQLQGQKVRKRFQVDVMDPSRLGSVEFRWFHPCRTASTGPS